MMRKWLFAAGIAPAALLAANLDDGTARAQRQQDLPLRVAPISAQERQQGEQASAQLIAQFGGSYDGPQARYVETIARRVAVESGLSADPRQFTVTLLDSPIDNAFATPGGYIYVTRGLMALMNDEAELAAVLGHEVGHVAARHGQRRQQRATRNTILGVLGQMVTGAVLGDSTIGNLATRAVGAGAQLDTLGYSRSQETESDRLAVRYLAGADYDTDSLASMLGSLSAQSTLNQRIAGNVRSAPAWASTHPDPQSRVRAALADAARVGGTTLPRNRDAYLNAIDGMVYGDNPKQGIIQGREFLHPVFRIGFTVPQGYQMQNGSWSVTITGQQGQAEFTTAPYSGDLDGYVRAVMQSLGGGNARLPDVRVARTTVNGIPAAYATIRASSGRTPVDATVFAYATGQRQAFHFTLITPAGRGLGALESLVGSFRTLTPAQAAQVRAKYLRVVTVRRGDTVQSLAGRMVFDDNRLERFLVLNGLQANAALTPGQRVKIVTY